MGVTCLCPGPVATEIGDAMNFFSENIDIHGAGEAFAMMDAADVGVMVRKAIRSEEHTSELQSLMRISYAVFCLKKKKTTKTLAVSTTAALYKITHKRNRI